MPTFYGALHSDEARPHAIDHLIGPSQSSLRHRLKTRRKAGVARKARAQNGALEKELRLEGEFESTKSPG